MITLKQKFGIYTFVIITLLAVALLASNSALGQVGPPKQNFPEHPNIVGDATQPNFQTVDVGGHCRAVRQIGGTTYFIPTNTADEWISMINNNPADVEMKSCVYELRCPDGEYYHRYAYFISAWNGYGCVPCGGGAPGRAPLRYSIGHWTGIFVNLSNDNEHGKSCP